MPELARIGARFDTRLRDLRGRVFIGRFAKVPEGNPTSAVPQKRLLRVHRDCFLKAGDIVLDHLGLKYLLAEGPTGMARDAVVNRTFRCIEVDRYLTWTRRGKTVDPVTRLQVDGGTVDLGMIWCNVDPREERLERSSKVASNYEKWKLYTNADIQIDDLIGGQYVAVRAEMVAGIRIVDIE